MNLRPGQPLPRNVRPLRARSSLAASIVLALLTPLAHGAGDKSAFDFHEKVEPILTKYCADCHMDGEKKGDVDFDAVKAGGGLGENHDLWLKVLKNMRAGLMPPEK